MHATLQELLRHKGDKVHTISPEHTVLSAVQYMNDEKIGSLLVHNEHGVLGIISERDILCRVVDAQLDTTTATVGQIMTKELVTVKPTTTMEEAMSVCTEKRCRHLPVMDGDRLVGLISSGDLTRWVVRNQAFHIQDLVGYITSKYPG